MKEIKTFYKKTNGWIQALVVFTFLIIPGFLMWFFLSKDWNPTPLLSYGYIWLVSFGFIVYSILIIIFFIWIEVVWMDVFNISLPTSIIMAAILLTAPLPSWSRAIIIILLVLLTFPINMFVAYLTEKIVKRKHLKKIKSLKIKK